MAAKYKLQKNGEDVTAQQAYDAFMDGVVLIAGGNGMVALVTGIQWCDSNGGQDDPTDVVYVNVAKADGSINVGTPPQER